MSEKNLSCDYSLSYKYIMNNLKTQILFLTAKKRWQNTLEHFKFHTDYFIAAKCVTISFHDSIKTKSILSNFPTELSESNFHKLACDQ